MLTHPPETWFLAKTRFLKSLCDRTRFLKEIGNHTLVFRFARPNVNVVESKEKVLVVAIVICRLGGTEWNPTSKVGFRCTSPNLQENARPPKTGFLFPVEQASCLFYSSSCSTPPHYQQLVADVRAKQPPNIPQYKTPNKLPHLPAFH